jgi:succinate dehydrogenase / fumarate reductase cytochrome b subunit
MQDKALKKRPLSPHLTIYKPQVTSILSIMHRITGASMFFGVILLSWLVIAILMQTTGLSFFETDFGRILDNLLFRIMLMGLIYCLYYHSLNGVRHLFWDLGIGINNKAVSVSGVVVVTVAIILTAVTFFIASYNAF